MTEDSDYGGLVPDIDETISFLGVVLLISAAFLGGLAGAAVTAWAVLR